MTDSTYPYHLLLSRQLKTSYTILCNLQTWMSALSARETALVDARMFLDHSDVFVEMDMLQPCTEEDARTSMNA